MGLFDLFKTGEKKNAENPYNPFPKPRGQSGGQTSSNRNSGRPKSSSYGNRQHQRPKTWKQQKENRKSAPVLVEINRNGGNMDNYTNGSLNPDRASGNFVGEICLGAEDDLEREFEKVEIENEEGITLVNKDGQTEELSRLSTSPESQTKRLYPSLKEGIAILKVESEASHVFFDKVGPSKISTPSPSTSSFSKKSSPDVFHQKLASRSSTVSSSSSNRSNYPITALHEDYFEMLDNIESKVQKFRETAFQLQSDKDELINTLSKLSQNKGLSSLSSDDKDMSEAICERLLKRLKTVNVVIETPRNEDQTKALEEINILIQIEMSLNDKSKLQRYLNACSPDEPDGPIDLKFQTKIVECAADDQKLIRRQLTQLISNLQ